MSKVITFSRVFPAYHPKRGIPTLFAEKLLLSLNEQHYDDDMQPKYHTVRAGKRWKAGEWFSPRQWSDKPYRSKQIKITSDILIQSVWDFKMDAEGEFSLDGKYIDVTSCDFCQNDGLSSDEFLDWFPTGKPFDGQVICWNRKLNYG